MALDPTGLKADLVDVFNAPTATHLNAAIAWASAFADYAAGVLPATTSHAAAAAALQDELEGDVFGADPPPVDEDEASDNLGEAIVTWTAALGLGQTPAATYNVPSPGDIATLKADLAAAFIAGALPSTTIDDTAGAIRDAVDTWMTAQTSEVVNPSPPPPTITTTWS